MYRDREELHLVKPEVIIEQLLTESLLVIS